MELRPPGSLSRDMTQEDGGGGWGLRRQAPYPPFREPPRAPCSSPSPTSGRTLPTASLCFHLSSAALYRSALTLGAGIVARSILWLNLQRSSWQPPMGGGCPGSPSRVSAEPGRFHFPSATPPPRPAPAPGHWGLERGPWGSPEVWGGQPPLCPPPHFPDPQLLPMRGSGWAPKEACAISL